MRGLRQAATRSDCRGQLRSTVRRRACPSARMVGVGQDGRMGARKARAAAGKTNDHIVSQMYLRRFGRATANGHQVEAALVDNLQSSFRTSTRNVAAEGNFYVAADADG